MTSEGGGKLTSMDAIRFLTTVKDTFKEGKKFQEFCGVLNNFKARRISVVDVTSQVKAIFKERKDLILEFNKFLPKKYEIPLTIEDEQPSQRTVIQFEDAINYVNKIKFRFEKDDYIYKTFLKILNKYKKEEMPLPEVKLQVKKLFKDHPDLLLEFTKFLPYCA